jgi:aryl-alcohol dehydrogenase-like predicted oxidoreductase
LQERAALISLEMGLQLPGNAAGTGLFTFFKQERPIMSNSNQARVQAVPTDLIDISGTKLRAARVALGTWAMGGWMWGGTDERQSIDTIRTALDRGVNLIDTAPVYGFGVSEEIVGKALDTAKLRDRAILSTKVGIEWRNGTVYRNATRARIMQEIDDSLRRLRTDRIDIYHVHWPDPLVPIEETAEAMNTLYERGCNRPTTCSSVISKRRFSLTAVRTAS